LVSVANQTTDYYSPWMKKDVETQTHLGTVVAPNRILMTAAALAGARLIEMQKFGSTTKIPLVPVFIDYEVNLALLKCDDPEALVGFRPLSTGGEVPLFANTKILTARNSLKLNEQRAILKQVTMQNSPTSSYALPNYGLEVQKSSGLGWSEPVVVERTLVGLSVSQQGNLVQAIPAPVIRHFISDADSGRYRGFPFLGIATEPLISPYYRELLGAAASRGGIRITKVLATSPYLGALQRDDVLVAIGGTAIDAQGYFNHPHWGRVYFSYLINQKFAGDDLTLAVLRGGKPLTVTKTLRRFDRNRNLIPYFRADVDEPHLIFGGLVFQELSRPYLMTWGKNWERTAPNDFLFFWNYRNFPPPAPGERQVILNRVLADAFNIGYKDFWQAPLRQVNGKPVASIAALREVLATAPVVKDGKRFAVFNFSDDNGEIILSYEGVDEVHGRIAENYGVNDKNSFFSAKL